MINILKPLPLEPLASTIQPQIILNKDINQTCSHRKSLPSHARSGFSLAKGKEPMNTNPWPALPLAEWKDTYATLHMWTQIVGKIRLALTPLVNHWWNTTLYVTPRGLTTTAMPYNGRQIQINFDFIDHKSAHRND